MYSLYKMYKVNKQVIIFIENKTRRVFISEIRKISENVFFLKLIIYILLVSKRLHMITCVVIET